jgi:hypothetical protein
VPAPRSQGKAEDPPETPEREASAGSSAASSTSSPYVAGPGPGFDAGSPPPTPPPAAEEGRFEVGWEPAQVQDWLLNAGDVAHAAFGVSERDWAMSKADLERIGPPLTRILNRFEPSRAVAAYSDPAAVAMGFGMYGWRSALERTQVLRARARAEELHGSAGTFTPAPEPGEEGPAIAEDFIPAADRLRATRPPEAP